MIILDTINKSLQLFLAGPETTYSLPINASWVDNSTGAFASASGNSTTTGASPVTVITAPGGGIQRQVKFFTVYNADTVVAVVTVEMVDMISTYTIIKCVLEVGDTLIYTDGKGFQVLDSNGRLKSIGPSGKLGSQGLQGYQGQGNQGFQGNTGGLQGSQGVQGYQGYQGPPDVLASVSVTGTTKTLVLGDANTLQVCSNAASQTITIPLNASVAFATDTIIAFEQDGVGVVTVVGISGVTVNGTNAGSKAIIGQYKGVYAHKTGTDTWVVIG